MRLSASLMEGLRKPPSSEPALYIINTGLGLKTDLVVYPSVNEIEVSLPSRELVCAFISHPSSFRSGSVVLALPSALL